MRPRDDGFLALLLGSLDPELEYAFDFRHESWAEASTCPVPSSTRSRARRRSATCACASRRTTRPPSQAGRERLRPLLDEGMRVYCYFKHEDEPTGPLYAERLLELLQSLISSITS